MQIKLIRVKQNRNKYDLEEFSIDPDVIVKVENDNSYITLLQEGKFIPNLHPQTKFCKILYNEGSLIKSEIVVSSLSTILNKINHKTNMLLG